MAIRATTMKTIPDCCRMDRKTDMSMVSIVRIRRTLKSKTRASRDAVACRKANSRIIKYVSALLLILQR